MLKMQAMDYVYVRRELQYAKLLVKDITILRQLLWQGKNVLGHCVTKLDDYNYHVTGP